MSARKARSLATLLRLRQWAVDDIRKELGALETERAALVTEARQLEAQVLAEQAAPVEDITVRSAYGAFARRTIAQRAELTDQLAGLDIKIDGVRERLREAFVDLKQIEIAERNNKRKIAATAARREAQVMDEAALQTFLRRKET